MCKIGPFVGAELTEKHFLDTFFALCRDNDLHARKACVTHYGEFCSIVREETVHELLVSFKKKLLFMITTTIKKILHIK